MTQRSSGLLAAVATTLFAAFVIITALGFVVTVVKWGVTSGYIPIAAPGFFIDPRYVGHAVWLHEPDEYAEGELRRRA